MSNLTSMSVTSFLDCVAERAPTPGGGSVAAAVSALAVSLARMVAAYSTPKNQTPSPAVAAIAERLQRTDAILRELINADAAAYKAMTAARKAAKTDPSAAAKYQDAVWTGIGVPMQVAAAAAESLNTMQELTAHANKHLLSDLGVAAALAAATARAARFMVLVNLPELADVSRRVQLRGDADRIVEQCEARCATIEAFVSGRL